MSPESIALLIVLIVLCAIVFVIISLPDSAFDPEPEPEPVRHIQPILKRI